MKKKLTINDVKEDKKINLYVVINLNQMELSLKKKDNNYQLNVVHQKKYEIDTNTDINKIIYEFYEEYVELKSIELFWEDELKDMFNIDIDLDIED